MTSFQSILIANRGEIAVRIIRTAKSLGYRTVAVYSDADAQMPHVFAADLAVHLGSSVAAESYLNIPKIIEAARRAGATAIHPGYGFLSESDSFAEACAQSGIVFIGPSPSAIRAMGNKAEAKRVMAAAGVPCILGYDGADQGDEAFAQEARRIGYPVMVKATSGGGGKGMRLIASPSELAEGIARARSEAFKAFGDSHLMLEKAVIAPRHVEVQVFADNHGSVVYVGDRDCSIQRRHQKIIEEAPAPDLDPETRSRMGESAVLAARAVEYRGAGTVEFLSAPNGEFYFLEMNTRLQVEHPVTEMVSGLDLVEWQIRIAAGDPLPLRQEQIEIRGHAIEARLYAEDPDANFLPQSGKIVVWRPPVSEGVRIDHGLDEGAFVSTYYDPMIAKVIGYGKDRREAGRRLVCALNDFVVGGIKTNRRFLTGVLSSKPFIEGELSTAFLDSNKFTPQENARYAAETLCVAAVMAYRRHATDHHAEMHGWRSRPWGEESILLESDGQRMSIMVFSSADRAYRVKAEGLSMNVAVLRDGALTRIRIDGLDEDILVAWQGNVLYLSRRGVSMSFTEFRERAASSKEGTDCFAVAPMPGAIAAVHSLVGMNVAKGETLLILEAMKMEHPIVAPVAGTVIAVHFSLGQQVATSDVLVEIEPVDAVPID